MRRTTLAAAVVLALSGALGAQEIQPVSAPTPAVPPKPFEDILKLWKAKLSEDFIQRQIETGGKVYDLSADDIIKCKDAGLPEGLIEAMLKTGGQRRGEAGTPSPGTSSSATGPGAPPAGVAPAPTPKPDPNWAAQANRRWEGLSRRTTGLVLKSRWKDVGYLEFKEETLRWIDADEEGKNLLVPIAQVREQFLNCEKQPGANVCFEWGFTTKDDTYRFRDVAWEQGQNLKVEEIYDFFAAIYPKMISSKIPVEKK